jgi:hypothetical protein
LNVGCAGREATSLKRGRLCGDRVQALAHHHSVFEIDPDGTGSDYLSGILRDLIRIGRVAAFEIHGHGNIDAGTDALDNSQNEIKQDCLAVVIAMRGGHRPTSLLRRRVPQLPPRLSLLRRPKCCREPAVFPLDAGLRAALLFQPVT